MKKVLLILLVAILVLTLVGCKVTNEDGVDRNSLYPGERLEKGFFRLVDKEAGVVCWVVWDNGIDCMPIGETALRIDK